MKILFGQPYFRILDPKEFKRQMPYPPLGALYAATLLRDLGHEIVFFDSMLSQNPKDFIKIMTEDTNIDLVVIYDDEFNYLTKMCLSRMRDLALTFIEQAFLLHLPSVIYSSDAIDHANLYLEKGCLASIIGEGEMTLIEIIGSLEAGTFNKDKKTILGIKYLENNQVFSNPKRDLVKNLDTFPDPDYSFVNMDEYRAIWLKYHLYFSINVSTTRGCPFKCNWCAKPLYGRSYQSRSPKRVAQELAKLKEKYQINHVWITDDIFGLKPNWINEFVQECKNVHLEIPYKCLSRADLLLRVYTIEKLAESHCEIVWIGAESGSQKILDAMDKGIQVSQVYEATKKLHEKNIKVAFFLQFGYLGENWKDILLTRKLVKECLPDDIGVSVSYPLPGTVFYEKVKNEMQRKTNWIHSDDLDLMFSGTYPPIFYKKLHRLIHAEYNTYKILQKHIWTKIPLLILYRMKSLYFELQMRPYLKDHFAKDSSSSTLITIETS